MIKNLDKEFMLQKNFQELNFLDLLRTNQLNVVAKKSHPVKKEKEAMLPKFFKEQKQWKNIIKQKKKQITSLKADIRHTELHNVILTTIFAIILVLSLISLVILTPLSFLGLALHATHFIWSLGIGSGFIGIGIGTLLIKSMSQLTQHKKDLRQASFEKNRLKTLINKGDEVTLFLNYEKLFYLKVIKISAEEHLKLVKNDIWHHPWFQNHLEDLEQVVQYEKNDLDIPKEIRSKVQHNFQQLINVC